jgi:hypothetical protein
MRRALATLLLILLAAGTADAQALQVKIGKPRLGYLSENDPGWFPVSVPLENTGDRPIAVKIVATLLDRNMGADGSAERTVLLPEKSRRVESVYLHVSDSCSGVRLAVLAENGHPLFETQRTLSFRPVQTDPPILFHALLVREGLYDPSRIDWIMGRTTAQTVVPLALTRDQVEARELPDRPLGYDGIDLVVLSETSVRDLDESRRAALLAWVRNGGRVLLLPGADPAWFRDELPRSLLPQDLTIEAAEVTALPELERNLNDAGILRAPGRTPFRVYVPHSTEGGMPIHIETTAAEGGQRFGAFTAWKLGAGDVILSALDLEAPPFDHWAHARDELARQLFSVLAPVPAGTRRRAREQMLKPWFEQAAEESELPSPLLLIPVVAAYILCVGPLNQRLVRRLDNPVLSVVTIPLISTAFAGVVFGAGYVVRGSTMGLDRLTVIQARPGEDTGWQWSALRIRSASSATYRITSDARLVASQVVLGSETVDRDDPTNQRHGVGKLVIQDEGRFAFPDLPLNLWERAFFEGHGPCALGSGISIAVGAKEATITNGSTLQLGPGVLFIPPGDQGISVPPLAPGASARVDIAVRTVRPERVEILGALLGDAEARRLATRSLDSFVDHTRTETTFVASVTNPPGSLELDNRSRPSRELAVLIVESENEEREGELYAYAENVSRGKLSINFDDALAALDRIRPISRQRARAESLASSIRAYADVKNATAAFARGDMTTARKLLRPHIRESHLGEAANRELTALLSLWEAGARDFERGIDACRKEKWSEAYLVWSSVASKLDAGIYFADAAKIRAAWLERIERHDGDELRDDGERALKKGRFWEAEVAFQRSATALSPPGRSELEAIVARESAAQGLLARAEAVVKSREAGGRYREAIELLSLLATYLPDGDKDKPGVLQLQERLAREQGAGNR